MRATLMVLALAVAFAACGGANAAPPAKNDPSPAGPTSPAPAATPYDGY